MISLRVLGSVDLRKDDGQSVYTLLAQPKRVALLALLCIRSAEGLVRREVVATLFWPEHDHEHARAGLRTALHALRRALGEVIATRGNDEVGIERDTISCDAVAFEEACSQERWHEALELYHGEFLGGMHVYDSSAELDRWLEQQRAHYLHMATNAAWQLCAIEERRGNLSAALELARRAVAWNGTDEVGMRRLLRLHDLLGDRAGALAAFEAFSRELREELDVEPSAETLALVEALRRGTSSAPRVLSAGLAGASPMTDHRVLWPSEKLRRWATVAAGVAVVLVLLGSGWSLSLRAISVLPSAPPSGSVRELATGVRGFLRVTGMPTPLSHASAVYDALRDKVYVFGGSTGRDRSNEVWELDSPAAVGTEGWTRLEPRGRQPQPRFLHSAAYDSTSDHMIVFGGALGSSAPCADDVWLLENPSGRGGRPEWLELETAGTSPAARGEHSAVWIPRSRRMVVFGGHDCIAQRMNDTWVLDMPASVAGRSRPQWRRIALAAPAPAPRSHHSAIYDAERDRMLLFGGVRDGAVYDDVWELVSASSDAAAWRPLRIRGPLRPRLSGHQAAWDPIGRQMIVFGGNVGESDVDSPVWLMSDNGDGAVRWKKLSGWPVAPAVRCCHGLAYNSALDQLIVFGGATPGGLFLDAWVLMNVTGRKPR